ncbi:MAG TPA: hypothetical protein VI583_04125, partial [Cyclobacteriaceae bacterium]|nr:hypothetical protein [Cyclobacteriaceae bacterium]
MASQKNTERINFGKIKTVIDYPDFLDIQVQSFKDFLQLDTPPDKRKDEGLYKVFSENFPIADSRENFILEFIDYLIDPPKYTVEESIDRGLTYSVPLKAKLRLSCNDPDNEDFETIEQEVFLGNIPYMTEKGSFVINGAERVIVSQLHRSPGVFFAQSMHTNGTRLYQARIIPFKGSWIEFATDVNNVMYAYIDRKKKFPVTMLLRALGFSSNEEILALFNLTEEVVLSSAKVEDYVGRQLANDVIDTKTGEVFMALGAVLTEEDLEKLKKSPVKRLKLFREEYTRQGSIIANTIEKDPSRSEEDALEG